MAQSNPESTVWITIPAGTLVGCRFLAADGREVVNKTVELVGDAIVEAVRDVDGMWVYGVGRRRYYCAGGLATICPSPDLEAAATELVDVLVARGEVVAS